MIYLYRGHFYLDINFSEEAVNKNAIDGDDENNIKHRICHANTNTKKNTNKNSLSVNKPFIHIINIHHNNKF